MSAKERIRLDALGRVKRKELTVLGAADLMGLSLRQARRIWKRFKASGDVPCCISSVDARATAA